MCRLQLFENTNPGLVPVKLTKTEVLVFASIVLMEKVGGLFHSNFHQKEKKGFLNENQDLKA